MRNILLSMRTTLNLDKDVLDAAKALAEKRHVPVGVVVSELARRGLSAGQKPAKIRNGFNLFSARPDTSPVTPKLIKKLMEGAENK